MQRLWEELEVAAFAHGAEFHDLDLWHESRGSEHHSCRQPIRLSLSQRLRRRVVDQAPAGAERDCRSVLAAELVAVTVTLRSPVSPVRRKDPDFSSLKKRGQGRFSDSPTVSYRQKNPPLIPLWQKGETF